MENLELVQKLKLELIRGYEKYVRAVAGLTSTSLENAREAFHTSICRMLVGLKKRPPGNPIVAWRPYIVQAAVNALNEKSRQVARRKHNVILFSELDTEGRQKLMAIPDPEPRPEKHLENEETARILWTEVASLSPRQGEVLEKWAHGSSFEDISLAFGIKPSTVRELWSRGIRGLRKSPRIQQLAA
jgi:RNA polymerase sigma factor (sigma-70 family)